jgi:uncharacterized repeat protein (TIGR02543 family)
MKKKLFILFYCLVTIFLTSCIGNQRDNYLPEYESGYFKYVLKKNNDKSKRAYLVGFTELGLEQRFIVLPSTIDNYDIVGIGYLRTQLFFEAIYVNTFRSDRLEKLFVNSDESFDKRLSVMKGILPNCFIIKLNDFATAHVEFFNGYIISFDEYQKSGTIVTIETKMAFKIGNISYLYNYDDAPYNNYYWIDSYDNDIVEFIPPDPLRDGYVFDGWYKDSELTAKWDFDIDVTGDEIHLTYQDVYDEYTGVNLYAKWIKIDM